ncbi:d-4,5 unsaturated-glucuronyl hydrolase-like protein [Artomyces pyxidatus]|uniref:D-4,5 unsaturated-glucuronyl hydrolase-like protein n=1 Tax=Artomyces pyxidatus TaxID=48021 RepID=A0ACB8T0U2_9AGAM|nr:d-4,5 unsaturated-glucuronyl hydrolase-like protein [Artomyces pyxidatus]
MLLLLSLLPLAFAIPAPHPKPPQELFSPLIYSKLLATANLVPGTPTQYPQFTTHDTGDWTFLPADSFSSGFLPATFYALHERAALCHATASRIGPSEWLELGRASATGLIPLETHTTVGHAVGFLSIPFVDELAINPRNATALHAVKGFGAALAGRFNPVVGCTRSWDAPDPTDFQVIVDNMSTLDLFFAVADLTGNDTFRQMAISHADKTIKNHIRPDGSSFHLVDYNATTGRVIDKRTTEGFSNTSTWTRGHAFGTNGFLWDDIHACAVYKRTGLPRYLDTARRMATFFVEHIPADGILPWDFNAPLYPRLADSSAATVASNALLLLAQQELSLKPANKTGAAYYNNAAIKLLGATTQAFWKPRWQSLLSNGTVNNAAVPPNKLTGIVYGDYYFILAGNELLKSGLATC